MIERLAKEVGRMEEELWLLPGAVAKTLGVSLSTLRRWERKGLIHCGRTMEGRRRFDPTEVERVRQVMRAGEVHYGATEMR